ncbi:hypothetical protein BDV19DRAFT_386309 [Aspergillus venezuelensis]
MYAYALLLGTAAAALLFGPTLKALPGFNNLRLFIIVVLQKLSPAPKNLTIFTPATFSTNSPLFEIDINIHKTNSSYFKDLDESRLRLLATLFPETFTIFARPPFRPALAGTACTFFRPIATLQSYEVSSKILAWDEKWVFISSVFLTKGKNKKVIATAITKYVFKRGRETVLPEGVFRGKGLLTRDEKSIRDLNERGLSIARGLDGLTMLKELEEK